MKEFGTDPRMKRQVGRGDDRWELRKTGMFYDGKFTQQYMRLKEKQTKKGRRNTVKRVRDLRREKPGWGREGGYGGGVRKTWEC